MLVGFRFLYEVKKDVVVQLVGIRKQTNKMVFRKALVGLLYLNAAHAAIKVSASPGQAQT